MIFFARYEASQVGAPAIEPEHLLLGLMREDQKLLQRFLPEGAAIKTIRSEICANTPVLERIATTMEIPLAPETKRLLAYAYEESETLQHRHIGTEHLLLGLLREDGTPAAKVLLERGLTLAKLRRRVASGGSEFSPSFKRQRIVLLGVERLLEDRLDLLQGSRVGLVCNQASVDHNYLHTADLFHRHPEVDLTALFGPQHGIRGDVQDNMIETEHSIDRATQLPIYSLYSETREPSEEMLNNVDVLLFDMQDVGCRIYTFAYTMANCMRAAKAFDKKVIVCDRPNPINGVGVSGNVLEPEWASFVGQFPIPTRHGMTLGELALMFNNHFKINCDLKVVEMGGWNRTAWIDETDAPWVMPSPNIPTVDTATVFPGTVHFEGTQLSEGRGTTRPFELIGAPYIVPEDYAEALNSLGLKGVFFRSCVFRPTFQKHGGVSCGGVQIHVTDRNLFEPVITGVAMVRVAFNMYRQEFRWKEPPYEYVYDRNPFDVICGTSKLRQAIEEGSTIDEIEQSWQPQLSDFHNVRQEYLLY